jgi:glutaredoxin
MPEPRFRCWVAALQWRWLRERRLALWIEPVRGIVLLGKTPVLFETLPRDSPWGAKKVNESHEDERLAASEPRLVTLYTRPGCHLCDEAKALIEPMLGEFGATLREVNIDEDAVLRQRYGTDIPVIFIGSRKAAKHRVDPVKFRRQLRDAI